MRLKMRTQLFGIFLLVVLLLAAGDCPTDVITIQLHGTQHAVLLLLRRAQYSAESILQSAGIKVVWNTGSARALNPHCVTALSVDLVKSPPQNRHPEALAYAFPYQNGASTITIFYGRIIRNHPRPDQVLAHVIVHEVTHILQ